jgi:acid stress-induced BolA-like protein IbaG/YrbA
MDVETLTQTLRSAFPGSTAELEPVEGTNRIGGFLIWPGFDEMDQLDRQRTLSAALRARLNPDEILGVSTILTLTPDEVAVMRS